MVLMFDVIRFLLVFSPFSGHTCLVLVVIVLSSRMLISLQSMTWKLEVNNGQHLFLKGTILIHRTVKVHFCRLCRILAIKVKVYDHIMMHLFFLLVL